MLKRIILTILATLVALVSLPIVGHAEEYSHYGTLYGYLADKKINLYVNATDARNHDGWCYVPGDSSRRKSFWSCTISQPYPNIRFDFRKLSGGEQIGVGGKVLSASMWPLFAGDLPYCLPEVSSIGPNLYLKVYSCAYWEYSA